MRYSNKQTADWGKDDSFYASVNHLSHGVKKGEAGPDISGPAS